MDSNRWMSRLSSSVSNPFDSVGTLKNGAANGYNDF